MLTTTESIDSGSIVTCRDGEGEEEVEVGEEEVGRNRKHSAVKDGTPRAASRMRFGKATQGKRRGTGEGRARKPFAVTWQAGG